jgi:hypothetical protein
VPKAPNPIGPFTSMILSAGFETFTRVDILAALDLQNSLYLIVLNYRSFLNYEVGPEFSNGLGFRKSRNSSRFG